MLEELDKKEKVRTWLEKKMEDPVCAGLDFGAYLIMPIQRTHSLLTPLFVSLILSSLNSINRVASS